MVIDVLVPVFNVLDKTKMFVESLAKQIPYRLIVVDNGSDRETKNYLKSLNVLVITNPTNKGYVRAMNQGLKYVENDYVLFANNDIILPESLMERLKAHLENFDVVGPLSNKVISSIKNDSNPLLVDYEGDLDSIEAFSEQRFLNYKGQSKELREVYGHSMLMKRQVLDNIGFLDECYGIGNYDDMDFCRRVVNAGMRVGLAKDCFVYHFCHATFDELGIDVDLVIKENQKIYDGKWA